MIGKSWLYDAILYVYALSLLFMFADFAMRNPRAKQIGTGLLAFVWVLQTVYLFAEATQTSMETWFSIFSSLFFFSWLIVTISLVLNFIMRIDALFLVNVVGFAAAAFTFFTEQSLSGDMLSWNVRDDLLFIHISLAIAGYAAFLFSAIFSIMLLFMYRMLKSKRWNAHLSKFPSLDEIHKWANRFTFIGIPLLFLSLVLGLAWVATGREWALLLDIKVINSVLILILYLIYLWKRYKGHLAWTGLAILNLVGFVAVVVNVLFSNQFSNFH